mmetsp:Transcript_17785/g.50909  ORF Transcript_17785/g.50909 Transcript_17785/m.50909 type:complete len:336 (-) Transcript_17785:410-1417(-)
MAKPCGRGSSSDFFLRHQCRFMSRPSTRFHVGPAPRAWSLGMPTGRRSAQFPGCGCITNRNGFLAERPSPDMWTSLMWSGFWRGDTKYRRMSQPESVNSHAVMALLLASSSCHRYRSYHQVAFVAAAFPATSPCCPCCRGCCCSCSCSCRRQNSLSSARATLHRLSYPHFAFHLSRHSCFHTPFVRRTAPKRGIASTASSTARGSVAAYAKTCPKTSSPTEWSSPAASPPPRKKSRAAATAGRTQGLRAARSGRMAVAMEARHASSWTGWSAAAAAAAVQPAEEKEKTGGALGYDGGYVTTRAKVGSDGHKDGSPAAAPTPAAAAASSAGRRRTE